MPSEPPLSARSRFGRLMGVQILGVGSSVPDTVVTNEDLGRLGCDPEWILRRTGITQRRHAPSDKATGDLAIAAAQRCLADANVPPSEVDLVLLGTYTPDQLMPATASTVQAALGITAPAFDIQAACTSFALALLTGMQYVATGCSRRVLVVGADVNSRIVDPADPKTYPLFGDAAGAVLLAPGGPEQGILAFAAGSDGAGAPLLYRPMGGTRDPFDPLRPKEHFLRMDGRAVFKWAIRTLRETTEQVLAASGLTLDDVDLVVFHQANLRIIDSAAAELKLPPHKVFNNLDRYGNTASASIPLALDEAVRAGRIVRGSRVLFSGFGGGLSWATILLQW